MTSLLTSSRRGVFQTVALWLGLVALTIQGLVPVCLAGPTESGGGSIVICTVHGYQTIQLDADGSPVSGAPASDHGACFLCLGCHMGLGFTAPSLAQWISPAGLARSPLQIASAIAPSRPAHFSYVSRAPPA